MAGLRSDVSMFRQTGYNNPNADALTFLDENLQPVSTTRQAARSERLVVAARGFQLGRHRRRNTQVRGGSGLFSGRPAYVWISNQLGNTGVLPGLPLVQNTTAFPFNPNPEKYKPALTTQGRRPPATSST